jgi:penicillin-binding protein 1A
MTLPDDETREGRSTSSAGTLSAVRQLFTAIGSDFAKGISRITGGARRARRNWRDRHLFRRPEARLRKTRAFIGGIVVGSVMLAVAVCGAMLWALYDVKLDFKNPNSAPSILIEASDGAPLGRVGALGDYVKRNDLPKVLVDAVLSIEDRRFYDHWGIDPRGIVRAARANWVAGGIAEGGSTITQQLAKMQLVGNERSLARKSREAMLALWLESRLGKDEILTRYMNTVYLGAGVYGMSAAARQYFDKSLNEITLSEAAMLAGLIQAPSRYNPMSNADVAQRRAAMVIDAMLDARAIDEKAAVAAKAKPAVIRASPRTAPAASWFADWVARHEFSKVAGVTSRPMRMRTTLDRRVQAIAETVVDKALERSGPSAGASQAALIAMRRDGSVVAMVGGRDYKESQFNRAVDARRQPGSTFKLFVFYAALRQGYSLDSVVDASPIEIKSWRPENYGGQQYGSLTLSDAFAQSVNTAAVHLALDVGLDKVAAAARELGISTPLAEVPSMALGTNEASLLEMTGAFASIAAGRAKLEPWGIRAFAPEGSGLRQLSSAAGDTKPLSHTREIDELLRRVVTSGTGRAADLPDGSAAGKTGTSQDYRDAWFIGYSRDLVVGVWVGNDDRTPMNRVTGGSLPAKIWHDFVEAATPALGQPPERSRNPNDVPVTAAAPEVGVPSCNVRACASAYSSFRESDCTYQPFTGPRRVCEWQNDASASPVPMTRAAIASPGACDVDLCARRFRSFDPATCTYQPYGGSTRAFCDARSAY